MAQERKKRRIVLASILKPVDDTRMYEKMAVSLAKDEDNEVIVIGFRSAEVRSAEFRVQSSGLKVQGSEFRVQCLELPHFERISIGRLLAKWKVFVKVIKLKPSVLIITTHELLLPAVLLKVFRTVKIIYDIRENYYRNIIYSGSFPLIIGRVLAAVVRMKEKLLSPFADHFLLAEKGYETEFNFFRKSYTVIENKAIPTGDIIPRQRASSGQPIKLLFSGTLSESTGVFRAIEVAKELHKLDRTISLTIIGKASLKENLDRIKKEAGLHYFITLIGGDALVSHHEINRAISSSDFGILSYPLLYHTRNSKPTKLFEYLSGGLPIILEKQWPWLGQYQQYQAFVLFDFTNPDYPTLLKELRTKSFYQSIPKEITWNYEEKAFSQAVLK